MIRRLLEVDRAVHQPNAERRILGDAFLLKHNFIYRNVRLRGEKIGYRLKPAWPAYQALPLCELSTILTSRRIPFVGTASLGREIEREHPSVFEPQDLPNPIRSYHFHEFAHAIAHDLNRTQEPVGRREKVFRVMIGESFANSVESIAIAAVHSKTHAAFLHLNSFVDFDDHQLNVRRMVRDAIGFSGLFYLIFESFMYANFLYEAVPEKTVSKIVDRACEFSKSNRLTQKERKACNDLFKDGLSLSLAFRLKASQFHLRWLGFKGNIFDILDFDFSPMLEQAWSQACIRDLMSIVDPENH